MEAAMHIYEQDENDPTIEYYYKPTVPVRRASAGYDATFYEHPTVSAVNNEVSVVNKVVNYRKPWRLYFMSGMCIMLILYLTFLIGVKPWWDGVTSRWSAGESLVSTAEGNVGHGGVSIFFCYADNGSLAVIEVVGTKYKVYTGMLTSRAHMYVTMAIKDVNGDGKPDVVLYAEDSSQAATLINTGTDFKWQT